MLTDLHLGKNSFINWESRGTVPSGEVVTKIADYFDVTVDYLLTDDAQKTPTVSQELSDQKTFWNNFILLCNEHNIPPNAVCAKIGLSTAITTKWKNGAVPRDATLHKIANYFNVTVNDLLADDVKKLPSASKGLTENDKKLLELFHSIPENKQIAYLNLFTTVLELQ